MLAMMAIQWTVLRPPENHCGRVPLTLDDCVDGHDVDVVGGDGIHSLTRLEMRPWLPLRSMARTAAKYHRSKRLKSTLICIDSPAGCASAPGNSSARKKDSASSIVLLSVNRNS